MCQKKKNSSADPHTQPTPGTSADYFEEVSREFQESEVPEIKVISTLEKRTQIIDKVLRKEGREKQETNNASNPRLNVVETDCASHAF